MKIDILGPVTRGQTARRLTLLTIALGTVLVVTGCGNDQPASTPSTQSRANADGPSQPPQGSLVAFAQCMRSHGVADFPDPDSQGHMILPESASTNASAFQAASQTCQHLLPADMQPGNVTSPQNLAGLAQFAQCMTAHGVPISASANGQLSFPNNIDPNSPQFQAAQHACQSLVPNGLP